jgi:hypothetical protein
MISYNVLIFVNTSILNTLIASSSRPSPPLANVDENQKASEKLQGVNLPPDPLSPYTHYYTSCPFCSPFALDFLSKQTSEIVGQI